jgi:hypothetical protein
MLPDAGIEKLGDPDRAGKVDRLALSLMELFGDRALEVSERQISMGNVGSVSQAWREISENIRGRYATR